MSKKDTDSHGHALELRKKIQSDEQDSRDGVREEIHFNADKDGQWEQNVLNKFADRPRYQFDLVKPVIDSIAGEIEQMEFGGAVIAAGGDANEEVAETYEKMCRTISNMSNSVEIFQDGARSIVDHGFDAWLIKTDWADVDSFDQDILIEKVPNAVDRVWLSGVAGATKLTDIKHGFMDTFLSNEDYKEKFPKGSGMGVSESSYNHYFQDQDGVTVSDYYYIKTTKETLHLLTDGRVVRDDKYQPVAEDLKARGITISRTKTRDLPKCFMRKMDSSGWLTDEKPTPFSYIPIIAVYGNFRSVENRALYEGVTRKLMDSQRVYNYAASREIADGALAPVKKIVATITQTKGHEDQNRKLNTANDPMYLYNPDSKAPPPHEMGGPQPNAQLQSTMFNAANTIKEISLSHNPQQGAGLAGHSGKAYEILNQKSDTASFKYVKALKKAVGDTFMIIVDAIPKVYDTKNRQMRLTNADGTSQFKAINEEIKSDSGIDILNDLSQGHYMFKVTAGPAYQTQRAETADVMLKWAALDPMLLENGRDILYKSLDAPGIEDVAARIRKQMVENGIIPESQLTDKEREKIQQEMEAAQNQPPNPLDEATVAAIQAEAQRTLADIEDKQMRLALDAEEQQRKMMETMAKIEQAAAKLEADIQKTQSETLENLRDATGADAMVSPDVAGAFGEIAEDLRQ